MPKLYADIYTYDGGLFYMVMIGDEVFFIENIYSQEKHPLDQLIEDKQCDSRWRNGAPPAMFGDYSWGCWRHQRPIKASVDRPCCEEAANEVYIWWDEIKKAQAELSI
jgi:hypothetical protein